MKVAILGAGRQAWGVMNFLVNDRDPVEKITVVDSAHLLAKAIVKEFREANNDAPPDIQHNIELVAGAIDASSEDELAVFLEDFDVVFNALPYTLALTATKAAIRAKCHLVDLGGNSEIVAEQLSLSNEASVAGVTIIPDCGLAPGLVSLLVADAVENSSIDKMSSVKIYVGGIPQENAKAGLLRYSQVFSLEGLVNEYTQPVKILRDGEVKFIDPLTELEEVKVPIGITFVGRGKQEPWMLTLEAFTTSGGASTLPDTYKNRVTNLEYKTLRFPGHLKCLELLKATDKLNAETFQDIIPKDVPDQVFVKVEARGRSKEGDLVQREYYLRETTGDLKFTAMAMCTAYPAAVIMKMLPELPAGVHRQEQVVNPRKAIEELRKANLKIKIEDQISYER